VGMWVRTGLDGEEIRRSEVTVLREMNGRLPGARRRSSASAPKRLSMRSVPLNGLDGVFVASQFSGDWGQTGDNQHGSLYFPPQTLHHQATGLSLV
jgi:hypothetical protein